VARGPAVRDAVERAARVRTLGYRRKRARHLARCGRHAQARRADLYRRNRRTQIAAVHCCSATVLLAITLTVRFWKCHPAITLPLLTTSASCRVGPTPYRLLATLPLRLYRSLVLKLSKSGSGVWAPFPLSLDQNLEIWFPKNIQNGPNGPRTRN
jgi:hypothetical protein